MEAKYHSVNKKIKRKFSFCTSEFYDSENSLEAIDT